MEEFKTELKSKLYFDYYNFQNRYIQPVYPFFLSAGLLICTSVGLLKKFTNQNCFSRFKNALKDSLAISLFPERQMRKKLVYACGNITKFNEVLAKDRLANISSSDISKLGLYRKVEVLQRQMFRRQDEQSWVNINMLHEQQSLQFQIPLNSEVTPNGVLLVENHQLTSPLLVQLANSNSQKLTLDQEKLQEFFTQLKQYDASDKKSIEKLGNVTTNPLFQLAKEGKVISVKDDYIYIQQKPDLISEGDIRISFYDVERIASEVTLFAGIVDNRFEQFRVNQISNSELEIQYVNDKKVNNFNISLFSFITRGNISKQQLTQMLISASKNSSNVNRDILLYSLIIFALYNYIFTYIVIPQYYVDDLYFTTHRLKVSEEIAFQEEHLMNSTGLNYEKLKLTLQYSSIYSLINIGILKMLTKGYVFSSIFVGFYTMMWLLENANVSMELQRNIKEDVDKLKNQQKTEKIERITSILAIFNQKY